MSVSKEVLDGMNYVTKVSTDLNDAPQEKSDYDS